MEDKKIRNISLRRERAREGEREREIESSKTIIGTSNIYKHR